MNIILMVTFIVKAFHGCSQELIDKLGILVDRLSINIELPSNDSLKLLAPQKHKDGILMPMTYISNGIKQNKLEKSKFRKAFVPARTNHSAYGRSNTRK